MDRGDWQATVHRVAKSWMWLKWLSTHSLRRGETKEENRQGILPKVRKSTMRIQLDQKAIESEEKISICFKNCEGRRISLGWLCILRKRKNSKWPCFLILVDGKMMTSWRQGIWKALNIWTSCKEIEGIPWESSGWDSAFPLLKSQHSVLGWDRSCKLHDPAKK